MKIKGAIFDMDGTLVESLFFWPMFWKMLGKKYLGDDNFSPDEDIDKRIRTMVFVDALKVINKHFHFGADDDELIAYADQSVKATWMAHKKGSPSSCLFLLKKPKAVPCP